MNLIGIYGYIFYGLSRILMSKNVNNDVTMNPPIYLLFGWPEVMVGRDRERGRTARCAANEEELD